MYVGVCGAMVCANFGFTVHTVSLLLPLQATRSQSIWRGLEELQVNILIRTNIFRCSCVSTLFTSWHCLLKSWSIVHGYLLSTYSCGIGVVLSAMGSGWSRIYCQPFSRAQLLELWYGVLEAL